MSWVNPLFTTITWVLIGISLLGLGVMSAVLMVNYHATFMTTYALLLIWLVAYSLGLLQGITT